MQMDLDIKKLVKDVSISVKESTHNIYNIVFSRSLTTLKKLPTNKLQIILKSVEVTTIFGESQEVICLERGTVLIKLSDEIIKYIRTDLPVEIKTGEDYDLFYIYTGSELDGSFISVHNDKYPTKFASAHAFLMPENYKGITKTSSRTRIGTGSSFKYMDLFLGVLSVRHPYRTSNSVYFKFTVTPVGKVCIDFKVKDERYNKWFTPDFQFVDMDIKTEYDLSDLAKEYTESALTFNNTRKTLKHTFRVKEIPGSNQSDFLKTLYRAMPLDHLKFYPATPEGLGGHLLKAMGKNFVLYVYSLYEQDKLTENELVKLLSEFSQTK